MIKFTVDNFDENHINKNVILKLIQQHQPIAQRYERNEAYYDGDHAIMQRYRPEHLPNNKVIMNFPKYTTDISTSYFMGNPIKYENTADGDIGPLLVAFDKAHVDDTDYDNAFEGSQNGVAFEYVYVAEGESELRTKNLSARNTFMIYDASIEEREVAAVYYRAVHDDATDRLRYVATVLTKHYKYELNILDTTEYQLTTETAQEHYFGEVPVICYQNNHNCIGDYEQSIKLTDAYNTVMSDRVNDKEEWAQSYLLVYGALLFDEGEEDKGKKNLNEGRVIEFPDKQNMGAEWLTRQLDEQGVEVLQKSIAQDIMRASYVPDFSDESFAQNSSGVALAFKVLLLEWMTKTKERYYRIGLRKRIRLFCRFLGLKQILMNADSIIPNFVRALPINETERANEVNMLQGIVSHRKLLSRLPFIEDPDAELKAVQKEEAEKLKRQQALFMMRPNTPPPEEDEEDETEE